MRTKPAKAATSSRDPEKTRARILAAATNEFAAKGFDGARVDTIARRAKTNKRMLYHYFGAKKALFEAIVGKLLSEKEQLFKGKDPLAIEDKVALSFKTNATQAKWLRLLLWEALAYGEGPVMAERARVASMSESCAHMKKLQKEAGVCPGLPPEHVTLALMAMSMFPRAFPQITRMLTGTAPSDPKFQASYSATLRAITKRLKREKVTVARETVAVS
ncbi:MAG: TetR/AcrR family transcriptional regulator [Polyangiaceae bacterium]